MKRRGGRDIWTLPVLRSGFEKFHSENGRYPKAIEMDACGYLCSARWVQMRYGGMDHLRGLLGISDSSYGTGEHRKNIGLQINRLAKVSEGSVGDFLISRYGEICVHEEKRYGPGRNRVDFLVYAKPRFAVEVFNTYTLHNLMTNLNMKLRKFGGFPCYLFFVVTGADFRQADIDGFLSRKKTKLPANAMRCVCFEEFKSACLQGFQPLKIAYTMI